LNGAERSLNRKSIMLVASPFRGGACAPHDGRETILQARNPLLAEHGFRHQEQAMKQAIELLLIKLADGGRRLCWSKPGEVRLEQQTLIGDGLSGPAAAR
jgi:hypothetical protein